jgi:hypothetical protein
MEYKELASYGDESVTKLLDMYRNDKYNTRVVYYNSREKAIKCRLAAFIKEDNTFELAIFKKTWGISKINVIYSREVKEMSIFKSKKGYYTVKGKLIKPLILNDIWLSRFSKEILLFIKDYIPFIELQVKHNLLVHKSFNYIIEHKLTSLKRMTIFEYGIPYSRIKKLMERPSFYDSLPDFKRVLYYNKEYITKLENINLEIFDKQHHFHIFSDAAKMARCLNVKINASWSIKRLKEEHDNLAVTLTEIVFTADNRELSISKVYRDFSIFANYRLLQTTKELALESQKQKHCIVTYSNKVNMHACGIYHIDGYTLELIISSNKLVINQFRGYGNDDAPDELKQSVQLKLDEYHQKLNGENKKINDTINIFSSDFDNLEQVQQINMVNLANDDILNIF